MTATSLRLRAADITAHAVPAEVWQSYRRFGYITELTTGALVERAARHWGWRPALTEAGVTLTYQELLELVERAGAWLTAAGVRPGAVVCWQTPNWWEAHVLA
ncbi:MAG TPA: AMP-binding protein, partial [Pseudonocardiaceae bacterium]